MPVVVDAGVDGADAESGGALVAVVAASAVAAASVVAGDDYEGGEEFPRHPAAVVAAAGAASHLELRQRCGDARRADACAAPRAAVAVPFAAAAAAGLRQRLA